MKTTEMFPNLRKKKGEVGIEIELEGYGLPMIVLPAGWVVTGDGSLRGESAEYVLRNPVARARVPIMLKRLNEACSDADILDTGRAGVHIHINVQDLQMNQVVNMICLYLVFEELLLEFCGEDRVGNLFCLSGKNADYLVTQVRRAVRSNAWRQVCNDELRYAAINLGALRRYGSLEFRSMRSTLDEVVLNQWVDMLLRIKDSSALFEDPIDMIQRFSTEGPEVIFNRVFGEDAPIKFSYENIMDGVRLAQHIAYSIEDWSALSEPPAHNHQEIHEEYEHRGLLERLLEEGDDDMLDAYLRDYEQWMDEQGYREE